MAVQADKIDPCPLCGKSDIRAYAEDRRRPYVSCHNCALVFVPRAWHVSASREKAEYDLHRNRPDDPAYRKFLSRLFTPLCPRLPQGAEGLDFGCGPGPALAAMFTEAGYRIDTHDKFYACNDAVFEKTYDFITATEVVEHLHHPGVELARLYRGLKKGGYLGIMTKLVRNRQAFEKWHYKNDPTHICFFSRAVFEWLARVWQADIDFIGADVILIQKTHGLCTGILP